MMAAAELVVPRSTPSILSLVFVSLILVTF